jgi:hypothetical protein
VAHREFVDANGVPWQAWEVIPGSAERRERADRRADARGKGERRVRHEPRVRIGEGMGRGWLVFASSREKRRIFPVPDDWASRTDAELSAMCEGARAAPHTPRRLIE